MKEARIKKNGCPPKNDEDKQSEIMIFRLKPNEKKLLEDLKKRIDPNLKMSEFIRKKLLDEPFVAYGYNDLPEETKSVLTDIAKLGSLFKMVAARKNITLWQEKKFIEDTQKIRELLDASHKHFFELQNGKLYYYQIRELILEYRDIKEHTVLEPSIESIFTRLELIYEQILKLQK